MKFPGYRQIHMFIFYVAFIALFVFCYFVIITKLSDITGTGSIVGMIFLFVFVSFFTFVIIYSFFHDLAYYKVNEKGITLCSPIHKNTFIPYENIKLIRWLRSEEITEFWHQYQLEFLGAKVNYDLSYFFKSRKLTKYLTRYSTINPSYRTTSMGSDRNITSLKTFKVKGNFILLTSRKGRSYYLTPKDPKEND